MARQPSCYDIGIFSVSLGLRHVPAGAEVLPFPVSLLLRVLVGGTVDPALADRVLQCRLGW